MVTHLPVKAHSAIIEASNPAHKLWYLMRAVNASGNGRCFLAISQILDILQISKYTLKRYYSNPDFFVQQECKFGKPPQIENGYLIVYPLGIHQVCKNHNVRDYGTIFEINQTDLPDIKKYSSAAQIINLQNLTRKLAERELKKSAKETLGKKRLPKDYQLPKALTDEQLYNLFESLEKPSSAKSSGIIDLTHKQMLVNNSWVIFGASQSSIAIKSNKSTRTINRRLKPFSKLSVAHYSPEHLLTYQELQHTDDEEWNNESSRYFMKDGKCFKRLCSLYKPFIHILKGKKLREKLNTFWIKLDNLVDSSSLSLNELVV